MNTKTRSNNNVTFESLEFPTRQRKRQPEHHVQQENPSPILTSTNDRVEIDTVTSEEGIEVQSVPSANETTNSTSKSLPSISIPPPEITWHPVFQEFVAIKGGNASPSNPNQIYERSI